MNRINYVCREVSDMNIFPEPLLPEEEKMYIKRMQEGDKEARDILIERNLRLVAHVIKKYCFENRDVDDLLSIGTIGLIKAINTFDPDKGNKLGTYAAKCIDNELLMMLRGEKKRNREVSLNEPIGMDKEGNAISFIDVLEEKSENAQSNIELSEDIVCLRRFVDTVLSKREKEIITLRYGLSGDRPLTQKTIGTMFGISRSYVSRIEKRALEKLKKAFDNTYKM